MTTSRKPAKRVLGRLVRGLTLIELTISLAVMAMLASFAVPEGGRLLSRWKLQAAAERLAADLQTARLDAVERGVTQHVHVQSGTRWCWSISESPGCGCNETLSCQRQRALAPTSGGIRLETDLSYRFEPTTEGRTQAQSVPMSNPYGDRVQVTVSPAGRARICALDSPSLSYPSC